MAMEIPLVVVVVMVVVVMLMANEDDNQCSCRHETPWYDTDSEVQKKTNIRPSQLC